MSMSPSHSNFKCTIDNDIKLKSQFFWDINDTNIQKFKNNFKNYDENTGYFLLDMMIYYNANHCREITNSAINELKRNIWLKALKNGNNFDDSNKIDEYIREYLSNSFIIPVSNVDESGKSSEMLEGYYKESSTNFVPISNYKSLSSLTEIIAINKPKSIIFVDDIIGTGNQFIEFFSKTKHFNIDATIEMCVNNNQNIDFYYTVFAADEIALKKLNKKYKNLKIIAVEIFSLKDRITNKNNEYWEIYDAYPDFMKDLKRIEKDFPRKCKYSLDLPILYVSGRAQNTSFEYFWNDYDNKWNVLKER